MSKTTIFLGSSSAAKSQAKAIIEELSSPTLDFLPWWDAFTPGQTSVLEGLDQIREKVNGALLLFTPELPTIIRKRDCEIPSLNVLFELGYFYGHFGKGKVAMLKYGDIYIPSNLAGYIYISGSKEFKRRKSIPVSKRTKNQFRTYP